MRNKQLPKLGPILRTLRKNKNIKQKEYAKILGLSTSQMSKLESGKCEPLEGTTIKMLALILPEINIHAALCSVEAAAIYGDGEK